MQRALELAAHSRGTASPNPMVGCVIVHKDKIIGEGWTQPYGGVHAEAHTIATIVDLSLLSESTAYVTLEPCAHFGKTPPCADLLVKHRLNRIVVACIDPNPRVARKGIAKLKKAGIQVELGLLEQEALDFNKRFFMSINKNRPYIILKWAETKDGFMARNNFDSKWISNEYSRKLVHKWRTEEDAIIIGTNTAKHDNPKLNVRDWKGRNPTRIVIDKALKLDTGLKLFDDTQPTLCYNLIKNTANKNTTYIKLKNEYFLEQLLSDLHDRKIQSVIVEGGRQLLHGFIEKNLWDEARIFTGNLTFKEGIAAPKIHGEVISQQKIMVDTLRIIKNLNVYPY